MKNLIIFLFFSIVAFNISAQDKNEKIQWNKSRPLSWDDFKADPDTNTDYSANTNSGISYSWNYSTATGKQVLEHEVLSNFYPNLSWVKDIEDEEYLLAHEQLHFDISELHARKLRKAIEEYKIGRTIRQDLKRIYNRIDTERVSMQNRFDKETSHSENKEAEMRWRRFVAAELEKYSNFSN